MRSARYCESTIFRTGITFASRIGAHFERRFARHQHFWIAVEKLFHRSSLALKRAAVSDKIAAQRIVFDRIPICQVCCVLRDTDSEIKKQKNSMKCN